MLKGTGFLITNLLTAIALFSIWNLQTHSHLQNNFHSQKTQIENQRPVVKIISPKNNSVYNWNSRIPYEINVSDKEDGESKYQEINPKQIFLEIKYLEDTTEALAEMRRNNQKDPAGLAAIKISNCMNCHSFKSKLIGPSFEQISKRYLHLPKNEDSLSNNILHGSKGRWGSVQMPSNNDLNKTQAKNIIEWIFTNAANPNTNYIAGNEGSFSLKPSPDSSKYVMLIASYTDHGIKEHPDQRLKGRDVSIIKGK